MMVPNTPLAQLAAETAQKFERRFGRAPRWIAAAPGRVNLIGEHTDYNDGFVFPMALERYTVIAADRPASGNGRLIHWNCTRKNETAVIDLNAVAKGEPKWANYVKGVIAGFQTRGMDPGPFEAIMASTVPLGGGVSSSAALEVSTATLLEAITGQTLDPVEKALLCQKAEHDFAGMPCGIMDQFISALGQKDHLLLLDCRTRQPQQVPMSDPAVQVLVINTNVKHELVGGEYAQRRQQCEEAARILGVKVLRDTDSQSLEQKKSKMEPLAYRRAKHVVSENERTLHAAQGVRAGNWPTVGQFMYASHFSLKDDFEVSCAELDTVVDIAGDLGLDGGVYGCRMTGGGFGGCCVALVKTEAVERVAEHIALAYENRTQIKPTLFVSRPAAGASVIKAG